MKTTFEYTTGREYNGLQVLEITVQSKSIDDMGLIDYTVSFRDQSRGIAGRTTVFVGFDTECIDNAQIGKRVLSSYDTGHYDQETFSNL